MTHPTTVRHVSLIVAALTLLSIPLAAQNPPAPAPPAPAPAMRAGMPCDSACRAGQGGMMGQMDHQMPMGQMGQMGQMNHNMMGGMGGMMMACPMMSHMGGMQGMQGHDMGGMQGMQGMQHGPMGADTAAVRATAEQHATFIRAYYQALVAKGFTADQAMRIITSQPMPGGR